MKLPWGDRSDVPKPPPDVSDAILGPIAPPHSGKTSQFVKDLIAGKSSFEVDLLRQVFYRPDLKSELLKAASAPPLIMGPATDPASMDKYVKMMLAAGMMSHGPNPEVAVRESTEVFRGFRIFYVTSSHVPSVAEPPETIFLRGMYGQRWDEASLVASCGATPSFSVEEVERHLKRPSMETYDHFGPHGCGIYAAYEQKALLPDLNPLVRVLAQTVHWGTVALAEHGLKSTHAEIEKLTILLPTMWTTGSATASGAIWGQWFTGGTAHTSLAWTAKEDGLVVELRTLKESLEKRYKVPVDIG